MTYEDFTERINNLVNAIDEARNEARELKSFACDYHERRSAEKIATASTDEDKVAEAMYLNAQRTAAAALLDSLDTVLMSASVMTRSAATKM